MKKRLLVLVLLGIMLVSVTGCSDGNAKSSEWAKNVEVLVPAKPGGGTDLMARALANKVSEYSGSTITIVNNTDGGGVVACEKVANAKKDGSTLLQWHLTMLIKTATGVYNKSAAEDFTVLGVAAPKDKANNALVVSNNSPYNTLDDLIAAAKEKPGEILFGVETGGTVHIQTALFAKAAGIDVKYVEAGSDTEKLTALVGNSIDACFVNANQAKQYVESGKVKVLGVISNSSEGGRSSVFPDVPDFIEQGLDLSFNMLNVILLGPKGMDPELAQKIHDYYATAANDEEVVKILAPAGMEMEFLSLEDGLNTLKNMQNQIDAVVEELGLKKLK